MYISLDTVNGCDMKIGVPSLEFMEFQNDSFFKDLTNAFTFIRKDDKLTTKTVFDSNIENIINDRLKSNIEFSIENTVIVNAYAFLPEIDKNHPFFVGWAKWTEPTLGKLLATLDDAAKIGTVDVHGAKLSGVFSKLPVRVKLTSGLIKNKNITDASLAGILLHELGHIFTYFYYLLNATIGGFITTAIATAAAGAKGDKERVVIFEKGNRILGIDNLDTGSLLSQTTEQNTRTLQTLYINETVNQLRTLTGYSVYEQKCCEQLADAFASRFGASRDLALGLYQMHKGQSTTMNRGLYYALTAFSAVASAATSIAVPGGIILVGLGLLVSDDLTDGIYDNLKDRMKYIRQHLVQGLKDDSLDNAAKKKYIDDIDAVSVLVSKVYYSPDFFQIVRRCLLPSVRKKYKAHEIQKTIEELLYNESYVAAAKFQGATK